MLAALCCMFSGNIQSCLCSRRVFVWESDILVLREALLNVDEYRPTH